MTTLHTPSNIDYQTWTGFSSSDTHPTDISVFTRSPAVLVKELSTFGGDERVIYTMHEFPEHSPSEDTRKLLSLRQIYMNSTTEYDFARKAFGSYRMFKKLLKNKRFMDGVPVQGVDGLGEWREEKKLRDLSLAKKILIDQTKQQGSVQAAKALQDTYSKIEKIEHNPLQPPKRERNYTKHEKDKLKKEEAQRQQALLDDPVYQDAQRLKLI